MVLATVGGPGRGAVARRATGPRGLAAGAAARPHPGQRHRGQCGEPAGHRLPAAAPAPQARPARARRPARVPHRGGHPHALRQRRRGATRRWRIWRCSSWPTGKRTCTSRVLSDFTDSPTETREDDAAIVAAAVDGVQALNARYAAGRRGRVLSVPPPSALESAARACGWDGSGSGASWPSSTGSCWAAETRRLLGDRRRHEADPARALRHHARLRHGAPARRGAAPGGSAGPPAQPRGVRRHAAAGWCAATGFSSRGSASRCPARTARSLPRFTRAIPGSIPTPPPSPTCTRTSTARGASPARACTMSRPSSGPRHGRFPENTLLSHDLIEGNYARAGLATDVIVYDDYPDPLPDLHPAQAPLDPGRLAAAAVAPPLVPGPGRPRAQPALAALPLEDPGQPPPQHGRAGPARLPGRRVDPAPRLSDPLDPARPRRDRRALDRVSAARAGAAAAGQVLARLLRARWGATRRPAPAGGAGDRVPAPSGVGLRRRDRADSVANGGDPRPSAGVADRLADRAGHGQLGSRRVARMWPAVAARPRDCRGGGLARGGGTGHRGSALGARGRGAPADSRLDRLAGRSPMPWRAPAVRARAAAPGREPAAGAPLRAAPLALLRPLRQRPRPTGSRRTTSRKIPSRSWRCARRPPTSVSSCWRR